MALVNILYSRVFFLLNKVLLLIKKKKSQKYMKNKCTNTPVNLHSLNQYIQMHYQDMKW